MTTHSFAYSKGQQVNAAFSGRIIARTDNTHRPDQYLVEINDGDRTFARWFYEAELTPVEIEEAHENVVPLKVAS